MPSSDVNMIEAIRQAFGVLTNADVEVDTNGHGLLVGRHGRYLSGGDSILC